MSPLSAAVNLVVGAEPQCIDASLDSKHGNMESDEHLKTPNQGTISSSSDKGEPIVTRRELWSYYCEFPPVYHGTVSMYNICIGQCTITVITYVLIIRFWTYPDC